VEVRVGREVVEAMISHAREEAPNECCGLLVGRPDEVAWSVRSPNLDASATRFLIDPETHFAAMRRARAAGLAVMGTYHSHPLTSAVPSAADLAEVTYPEFLHVIVSLATRDRNADVRGFRLTGGNFEPVELVLIG
jgi:[CysO sulfur-carrier protein]-S-L-cysteine hydrolase